MQAAKASKFGVLEPRDHTEHFRLRAIFQLGLEADHIVERAEGIILPQLNNGMGFDGWVMRIREAHRLHRSITQGFTPALGHHFNRQAPVEIGGAFPFFEPGFVTADQGIEKSLILVFVERTIDVISTRATRSGLVIA